MPPGAVQVRKVTIIHITLINCVQGLLVVLGIMARGQMDPVEDPMAPATDEDLAVQATVRDLVGQEMDEDPVALGMVVEDLVVQGMFRVRVVQETVLKMVEDLMVQGMARVSTMQETIMGLVITGMTTMAPVILDTVIHMMEDPTTTIKAEATSRAATGTMVMGRTIIAITGRAVMETVDRVVMETMDREGMETTTMVRMVRLRLHPHR